MKASIPALLAAGALSLVAAPTAADVRLHYRDANGQPVSDVYVRNGQVRMERSADGVAMLVDTSDGSMTMIDHRQRTYTVMDRDTMSRMRAQMEQMRAQMQQQLAALPEQQRKMMEQQMGGAMGGGAPPEFRKTGERRSVEGRECSVVEGTMGGRTLFTACVVPAAALDLPPADAATLEAYARVMSDNAGGMRGGGAPPMAMEGVPVASTDPRTGREETLSSIETGDVDAAQFAVPAGYVEQKMPAPGMGMPLPQ